MREHVVAPDDESIEPVLGMKMGVLYFGHIRRLDRGGPGLRRLLFFHLQDKLHVVLFPKEFGDRYLKEIAVILGNVSELELVVGRDPDDDEVVPDLRDLKIFDPGLIGNVAEPVAVANVFFDILPALFDDLIVHSNDSPLLEKVFLINVVFFMQ